MLHSMQEQKKHMIRRLHDQNLCSLNLSVYGPLQDAFREGIHLLPAPIFPGKQSPVPFNPQTFSFIQYFVLAVVIGFSGSKSHFFHEGMEVRVLLLSYINIFISRDAPVRLPVRIPADQPLKDQRFKSMFSQPGAKFQEGIRIPHLAADQREADSPELLFQILGHESIDRLKYDRQKRLLFRQVHQLPPLSVRQFRAFHRFS